VLLGLRFIAVLVDGLLVLKLTLYQALGTPVADRQLSGYGAL
jgi:hypothetical protein